MAIGQLKAANGRKKTLFKRPERDNRYLGKLQFGFFKVLNGEKNIMDQSNVLQKSVIGNVKLDKQFQKSIAMFEKSRIDNNVNVKSLINTLGHDSKNLDNKVLE